MGPVNSKIGSVLEFLHDQLFAGLSAFTLKVYEADIAVYRVESHWEKPIGVTFPMCCFEAEARKPYKGADLGVVLEGLLRYGSPSFKPNKWIVESIPLVYKACAQPSPMGI